MFSNFWPYFLLLNWFVYKYKLLCNFHDFFEENQRFQDLSSFWTRKVFIKNEYHFVSVLKSKK